MSYIALFPIVTHFTMNKVWVVNAVKKGAFSTPADFFFERYRNRILTVLLAIIFLVASVPYISSILMAISQAAQYATNNAVDYRSFVVVLGLIMTVFVAIGGAQSTALADTVQGLLFIVILWIIVAVSLKVGFNGSLTSAVDVLKVNTPEFFSYPGPKNWVSYASRFAYPLSCVIGWNIMLPHVFVRSGYFADNLQSQRKLAVMAPILQAFVWTGTMLIGLVGLAIKSDLTNSQSELIIPYLIENNILWYSETLAFILMIGFFVGTCAVGLSTANAFLSVGSNIIASDILENTLRLNFSQKTWNRIERLMVILIGVVATYLALDPPDLIFTLIMFAISIVMPLFPILVFAIYWKRSTGAGAVAGTVVGTVVVLITYFVLNIGNTWYGALGMVASTITMVVVSLATPSEDALASNFEELLTTGDKMYYEQ